MLPVGKGLRRAAAYPSILKHRAVTLGQRALACLCRREDDILLRTGADIRKPGHYSPVDVFADHPTCALETMPSNFCTAFASTLHGNDSERRCDGEQRVPTSFKSVQVSHTSSESTSYNVYKSRAEVVIPCCSIIFPLAHHPFRIALGFCRYSSVRSSLLGLTFSVGTSRERREVPATVNSREFMGALREYSGWKAEGSSSAKAVPISALKYSEIASLVTRTSGIALDGPDLCLDGAHIHVPKKWQGPQAMLRVVFGETDAEHKVEVKGGREGEWEETEYSKTLFQLCDRIRVHLDLTEKDNTKQHRKKRKLESKSFSCFSIP